MINSWHYAGADRSDLYPQSPPPLMGRLRYSTEIVPVKDKKVLVVGDSYGWYADYALKHSTSLVHSLDIAPPAPFIAKLQKKNTKFRHFQVSVLDFDFRNRYDLCVFLEVIEHLPPGTELIALKNIRKHLASHGKLLLSTPSQSLLSYASDPAIILGHRHYSQVNLEALLRQAGYKNIKFYTGGGVYSALDLLSLYFTKWILRKHYTSPFSKPVDSEYPLPGGSTIFALCQK